LVFGPGAGLGGFGRFATGLASGFFFFGLSLGEFLLMLCQFFFKADFGTFFEDRFGLPTLRMSAIVASSRIWWKQEARRALF
jgi:hypothetical protein